MDFFEIKLKYASNEGGKTKNITSLYVVEAYNYTDAETIISEIADKYGYMMADIISIKKVKFSDIVEDKEGNSDYWYKVKVMFTIVDEDKEKTTTSTLLVQENSIQGSVNAYKKFMNGTTDNWESIESKRTNIVEVIRKTL